VPSSLKNLRNVIVCDDIREEVGGKHSLMGVFGGDIVLNELPGSIFLAFYMQYFPDPDEQEKMSFAVRLLLNEEQLVSGKFEVDPTKHKTINLVLPRALVTFEKECDLRMLVKVQDADEGEVARKRVSRQVS